VTFEDMFAQVMEVLRRERRVSYMLSQATWHVKARDDIFSSWLAHPGRRCLV
jgi:hypothetical protein